MVPTHVVQLTPTTFEHVTQASTGQTTGHWCVLFHHQHGAADEDLQEAWATLAADEDKPVIYAQVNAALDDPLVQRLQIENLPAAVLFRDRKMYRYSSPLNDPQLVQSIENFVAAGYEQQEPQTVPKALPPLQRDVTTFVSLASKALLFGAAIVLYAGYMALRRPAAGQSRGGPVEVQTCRLATAVLPDEQGDMKDD